MVGENDDRSTTSRFLACLPLLLPMSQAFTLLVPLITVFPILGILFGPFALVAFFLTSVPFGPTILLVIFILLAQNKDIPRLVRFNLEQSALLEITLSIPGIIIDFQSVGITGPPFPDG